MHGENGTPEAPDWRYTPPTAPPMPARRTLPDACRTCALSVVACDATWDITKEACCGDCAHPDQ